MTGSKYFPVRLDDSTADYSAPHWQDNSNPLDGDAEDAGDRQYPVCFTRNTKMTVSVKMIVGPAAVLPDPDEVKIKGVGPGGLNIPDTVATVNGNEVTITAVECTSPFPNEVKWYGGASALTMYWSVSGDDGATWLPAVASSNEAFITLVDPQCSSAYRTVLYLACKGGGTTEDECLASTWANFAGPANVKAWDDTQKGYLRPLHYYKTHAEGVRRTPGLLLDGTGNCHAWAHFLYQCLLANGVSSVMNTEVRPPAGYTEFGVKNVGFDEGDPAHPGEQTWRYASTSEHPDGREKDDLDIAVPGLPGQNTDPPFAKLFGAHYIVHRGATYYDPSYGTTATGEADYTAQAVAAWGRMVGYERQWCKAAEVQEQLRFSDTTIW